LVSFISWIFSNFPEGKAKTSFFPICREIIKKFEKFVIFQSDFESMLLQKSASPNPKAKKIKKVLFKTKSKKRQKIAYSKPKVKKPLFKTKSKK